MSLDRRSARRTKIEMWVEEQTGQELYFERAGNLSEGGIYLARTIPHPTGTRVELRFTLPGETSPIRVKGEIVNAGSEGDELGMGARFVDPDPDTLKRIREFIDRDPDASG